MRLLRNVGPTVPVILAALLAAFDGGFDSLYWQPGAIVLCLGAAAIAVVRSRRREPLDTLPLAGLLLLAGYAAWTAASALWAANVHAAWEEAGRTALYLASCVFVVLLTRRRIDARLVLTSLVIAGTLGSAWSVVELWRGTAAFSDGRLLGPVGYYNGMAAWVLTPFWISIAWAASRDSRPVVRGLFAGSAAAAVQVAVLTQSRGSGLALLFAGVVYFALAPHRLRTLLMAAVVIVPTVAGWGALNALYVAGTEDVARISADVAVRIVASSIAVAIAVLLLATVDRRVPVRTFGPTVRRIALAAYVVVILGWGVTGGFSAIANVPDTVERAWDQAHDTSPEPGASRFASISSTGRIELWRVAWLDLERHPVLGVGADNYEGTYYQYRMQGDRQLRQPHNLVLEALAERGIVGGLLLTAFVVLPFVAGARALRRRWHDPRDRLLLAGSTGALAAWMAHAQLEWFWQIPSVTIPAMVLAGVLLSSARWSREGLAPDAEHGRGRRAGLLVVAAVSATIGLAVVPTFAAHVLESTARAERASDPARAIELLELAVQVDRWNPELHRELANRLEATGDILAAERSVRRQVDLDSGHWSSYAFAADFYRRVGVPSRERSMQRGAERLNPLGHADYVR